MEATAGGVQHEVVLSKICKKDRGYVMFKKDSTQIIYSPPPYCPPPPGPRPPTTALLIPALSRVLVLVCCPQCCQASLEERRRHIKLGARGERKICLSVVCLTVCLVLFQQAE